MTSLRRALWLLAVGGLVFGVVDSAIILSSDHVVAPGLWVTLGLLVGWGFIGVGLFAWDHQPENRIGWLMTATGFAWFVGLTGTSDIPLLFTLGGVFGSFFLATAIHMLLAAPSGRLRSRAERRIVGAIYALASVLLIPLFMFADPKDDFSCNDCPDNVILVSNNDTALTVIGLVINVAAMVLVIAVLVLLIKRWRQATGAERRLFAPIYASGVVLMITLGASTGVSSAVGDSDAMDAAWIVSLAPLAVVPYLLLAAFVRARMAQGGAVGELVARLGEAPRPGDLRAALAKALDDPALELVYWLPESERFVDAEGRRFDLPPGRAMTKVEREGECIAALVHEPMVQEHARTVGAAAALALANERLDAELRAKVKELRDSRERMLRIGLEERRRLERDLHDGAQQRLVSMALNMRLARAKLRDDPHAADDLLGDAGDELDAALEELRELARGIHPAVLSDRGLDTALETLARRAPIPVDLAALPGERLPEAVELAAYFVVAEALTNVAKYAQASHATVDLDRDNGRLTVKVTDDGVGGANPLQGTGLRGLADRLAVIEGRLEVDSERGRGTTVTARIPCA